MILSYAITYVFPMVWPVYYILHIKICDAILLWVKRSGLLRSPNVNVYDLLRSPNMNDK